MTVLSLRALHPWQPVCFPDVEPSRMTEFERHVALAARIDTLERHAATLEAAFRHATMKAEVTQLIGVIRGARASLAAAHGTAALSAVEKVIDAASLLLASLGRAT